MRVGFIGCVDSSRMALETLLEIDGITVAAVVTREKSAVNADFCNLSSICIANDIPYHYENPKDRACSTQFFKEHDLDVIFCVGWSYLLCKDMLTLTRGGVIGFHPASLPENRGRHPIIWALTLGLTETASTFFLMDEGADSGPIISQVQIIISPDDDASSLYDKILKSARNQILTIGGDLVRGAILYAAQDHSKATYWRKRTRKDGTIDFRMSASSIHNLVRALAPPYPGAEFLHNEKFIIVPRSSIALDSYSIRIEPGKVLSKFDDDILVKTSGKGAIWLHGIMKNDISVGEYL